MLLIYKSIFSVLFFLFILFLNSIFADESKKIELKWKENNSNSYSIQIKNEKGVILYNKIINEAKFYPELESGKYFYRIGSVKKSNIAYTKWIEIEVKISDTPEVISPIDINEVNTKVKRINIRLEGKNLFKQSKFFFESKLDILPVKINSVSKNEIELEIDTSNRKEEVYSLRIENPKNKSLKIDKYLQFSDPINRFEVIKRSLLIPGLGQYYRKDKLFHSVLYPCSMLFYLGVFFQNTYLNQVNRENFITTLNNTIIFSFLTQNENINYLSIQNSYESFLLQNEINNTHKTANLALSSIGIIYLLNLIDASFFHKYSVGKKYDETKVQIFFTYLPQTKEYMNLNQNFELSFIWHF